MAKRHKCASHREHDAIRREMRQIRVELLHLLIAVINVEDVPITAGFTWPDYDYLDTDNSAIS